MYDPVHKAIVLLIGNVTSWGGMPYYRNKSGVNGWSVNASYRSCDSGTNDFPQLQGPLAVQSTDLGLTWGPGPGPSASFCRFGKCSRYSPVAAQLKAAGVPSTCLSVTDNSAQALPPSAAWPRGRLLFILSDENEGSHGGTDSGDVLVYSDDGGAHWNYSLGLYQHGMSEGALAQLADGGVMAVMRHCTILPNSTLSECIRVDDRTALSTSLLAPGAAGGFDPNFRLVRGDAFSIRSRFVCRELIRKVYRHLSGLLCVAFGGSKMDADQSASGSGNPHVPERHGRHRVGSGAGEHAVCGDGAREHERAGER